MKTIVASAPGKLMLTGSYAVVHGEPCVVTAVDQRLYVSVRKRKDKIFDLHAPDLKLKAYSKAILELENTALPQEKAVRFVETLYKNFLKKYPQDHGISVTTKSDFSSSFGFGSSSAVTVAFAKALLELYGIKKSKKQLFDICYETVIEVQGVGSGFDIASAIWGGTIKYLSPAKVINKINIKNLNLVVGYTGMKADTPTLIRMVNKSLDDNPEKIKKTFKQIGGISNKLALALEKNSKKEIGKLFNDHQQEVRSLGVSSADLEKLILASLDAAALGASLSGAGGGDCMFALVDSKNIEILDLSGSNVKNLSFSKELKKIKIL
ncbi:MAG: mevalonate kinase, partial [Patescibacteria group bacterium]